MGANSSGMAEKQLFQMKFTSKQMARMAKKCEKQEAETKNKVKKAMEKGDLGSARIYAQDAIRIKNTGVNYLRLSSRLDAVASRVESAIKMQQVTKSMGSVVKGMDKVLGSMNVEAIGKVMEQFERSFEDMDVRSEYVEQTMNASTTAAMPEEEVDTLMQMVADEHGLKMVDKFGQAGTNSLGSASASAEQSGAPQPMASAAAEDDLEERLRRLRNT